MICIHMRPKEQCPDCWRDARKNAVERARKDGEQIGKMRSENDRLREALSLIATPIRPDGTWNRDREACRQLATAALRGEVQHWSDCATNNRGTPELLGPCDCGGRAI